MRTAPVRYVLPILLLAAGRTVARADYSPTQLAFPGWEVTTSEDAWANLELRDGFKHYPVSNLFDGDLATAWVFEGPKPSRGKSRAGYKPFEGHGFKDGGAGQWIRIECRAAAPPIIDAIGIVNGYAKSRAVYQRNNKISRIRLEVASRYRFEPSWSRTVELVAARRMQIVRVPKMPARLVKLTVEKVQAGPDDDLCVSEVQLYRNGRAVIPPPPSYVLYSPGDECGCGVTMALVDRRGRPALRRGALSGASAYWGNCYRFSPAGRFAAVAYEEAIAVADLRTGRRLFQLATTERAADVAWSDESRLSFRVGTGKAGRRYVLNLRTPRPALREVGR